MKYYQLIVCKFIMHYLYVLYPTGVLRNCHYLTTVFNTISRVKTEDIILFSIIDSIL